MDTYKLASKFNLTHGWGIAPADFDLLLFIHETARNNETEMIMRVVEDVLEDANFHSVLAAIHDGDYADAKHIYYMMNN